MNTRRAPVRRVDDEVVNEGVPPRGDQVPHGDKVPIVTKRMRFRRFPRTCLMKRLEWFFLPYPEPRRFKKICMWGLG